MMFTVLVFLIFALGLARSQEFHLMEKHIPRASFIKRERSAADHIHEVVIAIRKKDMDKLKALAIERATPGHSLYQKWLSVGEVDKMVMNLEGFERVHKWVKSNHEMVISKITRRKDYIIVKAPISVWERVLKTEFYRFEDTTRPAKSQSVHRALEYSIPAELANDINAVFHTIHTPPIFRKKYHRHEGSSYRTDLRLRSGFTAQANGQVTVSLLNSYYQIASNIGDASLNQSVFETSTEYFSQNDLTTFQQDYGLTQQSAYSIGGHETTTCNVGQVDCSEGNLDIQYIMGVSQVTSSIYWYVADTVNTDPFVTFITDIADEANPPTSNSISWGSIEVTNTPTTMNSFDDEASILASIGVTVTVSSGDDGAANEYDGQCLCNYDSSSSESDWTGSSTWTGEGYFPSFPATSPWVTAVGATQGPESGEEEIACQSQEGGVITTGGGFSTYYATPSWQTATTSYYFSSLTTSTTPTAGYNPNGRGYPDLSLLGFNYQVIINGVPEGLCGTSCSAPVLAAFVSLVNAVRIANNLTTIGFLNPTLYSVGLNNSLGLGNMYNATFNDITSGDNKCCHYSGANLDNVPCCDSGFTTVSGWDPVTGWGSIFFPQFAAMFDVAAPYTPPADDDDSGGLATGAVVAVVIVTVLVGGALIAGGVWVATTWFAGSAGAAAGAGMTGSAAPASVYVAPPAVPQVTIVKAQPMTSRPVIVVQTNPINTGIGLNAL